MGGGRGPVSPLGYDELRDADGTTRRHWRLVESSLLSADAPTLSRTQERVRRLRRDHTAPMGGVSVTVRRVDEVVASEGPRPAI
jgi:hypothetical protein